MAILGGEVKLLVEGRGRGIYEVAIDLVIRYAVIWDYQFWILDVPVERIWVHVSKVNPLATTIGG